MQNSEYTCIQQDAQYNTNLYGTALHSDGYAAICHLFQVFHNLLILLHSKCLSKLKFLYTIYFAFQNMTGFKLAITFSIGGIQCALKTLPLLCKQCSSNDCQSGRVTYSTKKASKSLKGNCHIYMFV